MPLEPKDPFTTGSSTFNPDTLFEEWAVNKQSLLKDSDLRRSIITTFALSENDNYTYHAIASVTLSQVQDAINHGNSHDLHTWYRDDANDPLPPPPTVDIAAYTTLFSPTTTPPKAFSAFASNARKGTLRAESAVYLSSLRLVPSTITIPRNKSHVNPAYDFFTWCCHNLEWCGPVPGTERVKQAHHVLPVMMHHFSCLVPSFEGLEVIKQVAQGREVYDIGSGNGYWTYMLRRQGVIVWAVDSGQSAWRTMWIGDTVVADGAKWLKGRKGGREGVCLMVYPVVGGEFTRCVVEAYEGKTVVVAGTMNRNGYTGFKEQKIDEWMEERGWQTMIRIPLPSFPGKDEGLIVFERS